MITFSEAHAQIKAAGVIGHMETMRELEAIFDIASRSERGLEIGSYCGFSAAFAGLALKEKFGILYCLDPFNTSPWTLGEMNAADLEGLAKADELFSANMNKLGLRDTCVAIKGYSFCPKLQDRFRCKEARMDFVFIDAEHLGLSVAADIVSWAPIVKNDGYVLLHDIGWGGQNGPIAALNWAIERGILVVENQIDSLAVCRKGAMLL